MKPNRWRIPMTGAVLASVLSVSAVGCVVTGFDLNMESMARVAAVCGFASLFCALCFRLKRGGSLLLCLAALIFGYLWHRGVAAEEIYGLICRISYVYNGAYGWGVLNLTEGSWDSGLADYPMTILGVLIAMAVSRAVCRGKSSIPPMIVSLAPLTLCFVVTDTVPDEGYLFALMTGIVLLLLTGSVRRDDIGQGSRLIALTALPVMLAMALLFLAIPQEGYVNRSKEIQERILSWVEGIPQMMESTVEDLTLNLQGSEQQQINLRNVGARIQQTYAVMDVTAERSGMLYLRGQDYDTYSGIGWSAASNRTETFVYESGAAETVTISTRSLWDILYLPYYPAGETTLTGGMMANEDDLQSYTVTRSVLPDSWRENIPAGGDDETADVQFFGSTAERLRYVTLPGETELGAQAILKDILPEGASRAETAEAIAAYVRSSAEYDLATHRMPSGETDFALWFLEDSQTGYCVHFATAAAVLLRAADIPARYVTGYLAEAKAGETVTVTAGNAHAWAEYFEPDLGTWVVLEATPADELEEEASVAATKAEETVPPEPETPSPPAQAEETAIVPTQEDAQQKPAVDFRWLGRLAKNLLIAAVMLCAIALQRTLRLILRHRARGRGSENARAMACWRETELLAKLLKEEPPEELELLAQKAKFSQHALSEEELYDFAKYRDAARKRLREKPWYLRLIYQYIFAAF